MGQPYSHGLAFRQWKTANPDAPNNAARAAIIDLTSGYNGAIAAFIEVAEKRNIGALITSSDKKYKAEECFAIAEGLRETYSEKAIDQAMRFLEGLFGFEERELLTYVVDNKKENSAPGNNRAEKSEKEADAKMNRSSSAGGRMKTWSIIREAIKAQAVLLKDNDTYKAYLAFIAVIDLISAWQASRGSDELGLLLVGLGLFAWIPFTASLTINLHARYAGGTRADEMSTLEYKERIWRALTANTIATAHVMVGLIILIIPGIIFTFRYLYVGQIAALKNVSIKTILQESTYLARFNRWTVFKACVIISLPLVIFVAAVEIIVAAIPAFSSAAYTSFTYHYITTLVSNIVGILLTAIMYIGYKNASDNTTANQSSI